MGIGNALSGFLVGISSGIGKEQQRRKLVLQQEKVLSKQRIFDAASKIMADSSLSPELRGIAGRVVTGDSKAEKELADAFLKGSATRTTQSEAGAALPSGQPSAQGPTAQTTDSGSLKRKQNQAFAQPNQSQEIQPLEEQLAPQPEASFEGLEDRTETQIPGAPTQEAQDRQVISQTGEEIPNFLTQEAQAERKGHLNALESLPGKIQSANLTEIYADRERNREQVETNAAYLDLANGDTEKAALATNLAAAGVPATEIIRQLDFKTKPTAKQIRDLTRVSFLDVFYGANVSLTDARADIEGHRSFTDKELRGIRAKAVAQRNRDIAAALKASGTIPIKDIQGIWNRALGATNTFLKTNIVGQRVSLQNQEYHDRLDDNLLKRGIDPTEARDRLAQEFGDDAGFNRPGPPDVMSKEEADRAKDAIRGGHVEFRSPVQRQTLLDQIKASEQEHERASKRGEFAPGARALTAQERRQREIADELIAKDTPGVNR
jgi:hypothetical protein